MFSTTGHLKITREWFWRWKHWKYVDFLQILSSRCTVLNWKFFRSNLEKSCKILLSISRSDKPHLQQLCLHFTTTWNHDQFAEITAQFSPEHSFHSIFMSKKKSPNWITGGWSIDRQKNITSGIFQPEKLRLSATFVERTSRYIEYWLRNFQIDTLRIKVENLIPGKENSIQQVRTLQLKK